jgi:Flp pilus assembly protein TadG
MTKYHPDRKHNQREKGFVLFTMSIAAIALFAIMGLAVDVGRMYITKNEAQSFADAGAIRAALKINGTAPGITTAAQVVASNASNQYNLGTSSFTAAQVTVQYSTTAAGPWVTDVTAQAAPANLLFARVTVTPPVSLYFLAIVVPQTSTVVPATAVAGQIVQNTYSQGLFPFSPITIAAGAPNFGYVAGLTYTFRRGNGPLTCTGEIGANAAAFTTAESARGNANAGYWSTLGNSNSLIKKQIINDLMGDPVTIGDALPVVSGNRQAEFANGGNPGAVPERVSQDTNPTAATYAEYIASGTGNGRRLVGVPVSSPTGVPANVVVGYAEFFLTNVYPGNGTQNYCAEYVGPWTQDTTTQGGGAAGGYKVRLVQ